MASVIGLIAFFTHHVARASGPITDPNDFGFILGSSVPLAIYQVRWGRPVWVRRCGVWPPALILACTLATFSRSARPACFGDALGSVYRPIRLRWVLAMLAGAAAVGGVALLTSPTSCTDAYGQKAHIAIKNINVRFGYYHVEISEWQHYPLTGVGPGNFVYRFYQFAPAVNQACRSRPTCLTISGEEAYLVILAEQGAPGLALFLSYLALSWTDLRRRFPGDQQRDQLQGALAAGFIVACIGALFLAEQYYPPLWFLPAVAASMASRPSRGQVAATVGSERPLTCGPVPRGGR